MVWHRPDVVGSGPSSRGSKISAETQTHSDQSVFTLERTMQTPDGPRRERLHVGVYVDDLATVYLHDDEHSLYRSFITALDDK